MKNRRFPYGYEMRDGEIVICQTEAEIVRTIFRDYVDGKGLKDIVDNGNLYIIGRKLLYSELQPLFKVLTPINYAIIKGEVLSQQIYGEPNKRRSNDIDILIDKKEVKFIEMELQKKGFKQQLSKDLNELRHNRILCMAYSHQIPSYHKNKLGFHLNVDVNHDIFWGEYEGKRFPVDEFLNDTIEMNIYGYLYLS